MLALNFSLKKYGNNIFVSVKRTFVEIYFTLSPIVLCSLVLRYFDSSHHKVWQAVHEHFKLFSICLLRDTMLGFYQLYNGFMKLKSLFLKNKILPMKLL